MSSISSPIQTMTHADYLAHSAYGSSDLIKMSRSFAYWKWRKANPEPAGRPLVVGSATHLILQAVLHDQKNLIDEGIRVYSEGSSLTQGFKKFQTAEKGRYCVDQEEYKLCSRMVDAILAEPEAMGYLKDAIAEPTIIANYPGTNVLCKCRPDYLHTGRGVSINIKTTTDASESGFIYAARDFGYAVQSVFYCDLLTHALGKSFDEVHILVEKTEEGEPPNIKIFSFGEDTLSWTRVQMHSLLEKIPQNESSGVWPNNKVFLESIELPMHMRFLAQL